MGCSKNIVRKTLRARTKLRTIYFIDPPEAFLNPAGFFNKIIGQNVAALKVVNGFFCLVVELHWKGSAINWAT